MKLFVLGFLFSLFIYSPLVQLGYNYLPYNYQAYSPIISLLALIPGYFLIIRSHKKHTPSPTIADRIKIISGLFGIYLFVFFLVFVIYASLFIIHPLRGVAF